MTLSSAGRVRVVTFSSAGCVGGVRIVMISGASFAAGRVPVDL